MGPIVGRTDDMLIVRGVNVYPSQVGAVLGRIPELSPHFGLVVRREGTLDSVEVLVEPERPPRLRRRVGRRARRQRSSARRSAAP